MFVYCPKYGVHISEPASGTPVFVTDNGRIMPIAEQEIDLERTVPSQEDSVHYGQILDPTSYMREVELFDTSFKLGLAVENVRCLVPDST